MRKLLMMCLAAMLLFITGCAGKQEAAANEPAPPQNNAAASGSGEQVSAVMQVNGQDVVIALDNNPASARLAVMLPVDLKFSDFNNTEKITYLPNKLNLDGAKRGHAPKAGDMCIYVPWGNICIFYKDYKYSNDLVYLGHVETGLAALAGAKGDFSVRLTKSK